MGVIAVFGAFNAVVSHYELVQSAPRAFYELGLVVVVALAFVPSTIAAVVDVARSRPRAHRGPGRAARPARCASSSRCSRAGSNARSTLAESMDSRGFAHGGAAPGERAAGWFGAGALLALGGAFVALVGAGDRRSRPGSACAGLVGVVGGDPARVDGRDPRPLPAAPPHPGRPPRHAGPRSRPRSRSAIISLAGDDSLSWVASPLHWPSLHVLPVVALVGLLAPLLRLPVPVPATVAAAAPALPGPVTPAATTTVGTARIETSR